MVQQEVFVAIDYPLLRACEVPVQRHLVELWLAIPRRASLLLYGLPQLILQWRLQGGSERLVLAVTSLAFRDFVYLLSPFEEHHVLLPVLMLE